MKRSFKWILSITVLLAFLLTGCSNNEDASAGNSSEQEETKGELKYRRLPTATSDLFEEGVTPILEEQGYTLTPGEITDSVQREIALSEDELDFHIDAHRPILITLITNREQI